MIYLDTHVACWLYAGLIERIPPAALDVIEAEDLFISPMVELEIQYLHEIGRLRDPARLTMETLEAEIGLHLCDLPFATVAARALSQSWTRDPFDRIIVAQASARGSRLVTKDRGIQEHYPHAFWEA